VRIVVLAMRQRRTHAYGPPLRGISLFSPHNATGLNLVTQEEPQSKPIAKIPSRRIGEVIGPWI
jgi:hypothetical protein